MYIQTPLPPPSTSAVPFSYAVHQLEDIPRIALHDGGILAHDPGLGKTVSALTLAILQEANRCLFVVPASLHDQWRVEARRFGIDLITIRHQADAYQLMRDGALPFSSERLEIKDSSNPQSALRTPQFFLTDWRWLGYNGADERSADEDHTPDPFTELDLCHLQEHHRLAFCAFLNDLSAQSFRDIMHLKISPDGESSLLTALRQLDSHWPEPTDLPSRLDPFLIEKAITHLGIQQIQRPTAFRYGIGESRTFPPLSVQNPESTICDSSFTIKCLHSPSLSTLICHAFDFVAADEAVRIKAGDSFMAEGILQLRSRFRYALTGTPIKNRLSDIFFLASWVTGHHPTPTARWPYGNTHQDQNEFANNHLIIEENNTAREERGRRVIRRTNQITNVHRFWKLLAPIVVRRRKDQVPGLQPVTVKPISIAPGTRQMEAYKWHVQHKPLATNHLAALGKQLQILRQAALCPHSLRLGSTRSKTLWTPKIAAILKLCADLMEQRQQVVIFSPFQEFSATLGTLLKQAEVPCAVLDGKVTPQKRGVLAQQFKDGLYPILIAGIKSMGEGHSFACASHLILPSLEWAYDENAQAIERVHRLNSLRPVTIYLMVTRGTIDERLTATFEEKGNSSDLALDGRLFEDDREEVNIAEFMHGVIADFDPTASTLCEVQIQHEWDTVLQSRLTRASTHWRGASPLPALTAHSVICQPPLLATFAHRMNHLRRVAAEKV